jgi:hydroxymethylpyrimidine pyrophosphatase-like HAD family hydrolase
MRYAVLATDYDGTLATQGHMDSPTVTVLEKVRQSGRKLILVTGRHLPDLQSVFSRLELFDRAVLENGALLYNPEIKREQVLCEPPPPRLQQVLHQRRVPFSVGRGILATWEPHHTAVLDAIRELGLDLQVIFNKGAVMVLPSGVNKASGLKAALDELSLSFHNVVGIGDAENDHAFLAACECGVAVANALPALKDRADIVTAGDHGAGVIEIANQLLEDDLVRYDQRLSRHSISLGTRADKSGEEVRINPSRNSILVIGPSASGKSTAVSGIIEQLAKQRYQFCLIDPEGDYEGFAEALSFGNAKEKPDIRVISHALADPDENLVINLLSIAVGERPNMFTSLLPIIMDQRARTARPHWLIVDEAHHLLPKSWSPIDGTLPKSLGGTILITVHPDRISEAALSRVDVVIATGDSALDNLRAFARMQHMNEPSGAQGEPRPGQALVWFGMPSPPVLVATPKSDQERRRHLRQYAQGELSSDQSFYFRGPASKLNLRAQNLETFLQIADGVDDATWLYHLRRGDYSSWFENLIKDTDLAKETAAVEGNRNLNATESRALVRDAIEKRYTAPS